jgi:hypothetical protein
MRIISLCLMGLALLTTSCTAAKCVQFEHRNVYTYADGLGIIVHQVPQCVVYEESNKEEK